MYRHAHIRRLRQWQRVHRHQSLQVAVRRFVSTWRPASNDRTCGTSASENFRRYWEAPNMEPDTLMTTVKRLRAERSGDVLLCQALSHRFLSHAEEFFPPQIDELIAAFADLAYADEDLLDGFTGRLGDVVADASPRRVVRLLRNCSRLQMPANTWLDAVLSQLHRHLPNLREGLPSALASIRLLGRRDEEIAELLLTQGLLYSDELGAIFFSQLFERWSWHGLKHAEAEDYASAMALRDGKSLDTRDCLNLLAGLWRCGCGNQQGASTIVENLESRLQNATSVEVVDALSWMHRLRLRSSRLWKPVYDMVEIGLKDHRFIREHLPEAIHALASLVGGVGPDLEIEQEVDMISGLFNIPDLHAALVRYDASQTLKLFHAACLLAATSRGNSSLEAKLSHIIPWGTLMHQAVRLSRQMSLSQRRVFAASAEVANDFCRRHDIRLDKGTAQHLLVTALPPLPPFTLAEEPSKQSVAKASIGLGTFEALWFGGQPTQNAGAGLTGIRYLGPKDTFAEQSATNNITPECALIQQALELRGWHVTLQAS